MIFGSLGKPYEFVSNRRKEGTFMKILKINMGAEGGPKASEEPMGDYEGQGGRALTSAMVSKEVPPLCHPLGAANKLVIAPGLLSGTTASMSGRISVGCKSPLTGTIKEANSGGQTAQVLARLGYGAIVLEGKPKDDTIYKVFINKEGVKITPDNSLKMLGNYDLVERMKKEHGDKIACISIGPAGEMKMSAASVANTDMELRPTRHAARGGPGAVMGCRSTWRAIHRTSHHSGSRHVGNRPIRFGGNTRHASTCTQCPRYRKSIG